jgi:prephenate dehydratase
MKKVGFLGPRGTFSQEAVERYISGNKDYCCCDFAAIPDMAVAVRNGSIDEALAPIENSIEGAVNATLDMMSSPDMDLRIKAEVVIPVRQNLLVRKGTDIGSIKRILSHPQPIGQCRNYISTNFPHAVIIPVYSTAMAAYEVAGGSGDSAAIGSITAAGVYGLDILARDVHDGENNHTRFVVISAADGDATGSDKTSIVFSTEDKPGSLYRVLDIFNLWDINMTRIESRPAKDQLGRYIFFIDIAGHRDDDQVKDALIMVKKKTSFYKFLGSYPQCGV